MARPSTAPTAARNEAMVCLLEAAELTPRELAGLQLVDFSGAGELTVPTTNSTRTVIISLAAVVAVRAWLVWRGDAPGPLFVAWSPDVARYIWRGPRPLTGPQVYMMLDRLARQADALGARARAVLCRLRDSGPNRALRSAMTRTYRTPAEQARQDAMLEVIRAYRGRNGVHDVEEMYAEFRRRGLV
jgi:integrase